jgi:hypothetical protein
MEIEDVVGVKFGIKNEVHMEEKGRGRHLQNIAGDSLTCRHLGPTSGPTNYAIHPA